MTGTCSIFAYGSTLSPLTRKPDSVPDLFALVDDVPEALRQLGRHHLARLAPLLIPPITIAYEGQKLSLISPLTAERELAARHDLYLAGRLSKKIELYQGSVEPLVQTAISTVVELSALDLPRRVSLEEAVIACLALSYRAEVRPEGPEKPRALYRAFADFYQARFSPRIEAHARSRGIPVQRGQLIDHRPEAVRANDRRELAKLLRRSRLRAILRWPQQLFIFRGSVGYVLAKLRRAWM